MGFFKSYFSIFSTILILSSKSIGFFNESLETGRHFPGIEWIHWNILPV